MKKALPKSIVKKLRRVKNNIGVEKIQLKKIPTIDCNPSNMISAGEINLDEIFNNDKIEEFWNNSFQKTTGFDIPDFTGGVNPGDRKAIFYLMSYFKPQSVLEIGTHIGASTLQIASALDHNNKEDSTKARFKTLDIRDVNCEKEKPWLQFDSKYSPQEMINKMDISLNLEFINQGSLDYLKSTKNTFDMIFLDGDHSAKTVYQEVPAALRVLREDGVILLHDYFENGKSPWKNDTKTAGGPYLAINRLIEEGSDFKVIPLGELPWKTKLDTNFTSLALLTKN